MPIMIMLVTSGTLCREQKPCSFVLMHTWNNTASSYGNFLLLQ